ncbi:MAG: hypothetical protein AUK23_03170 [Deltaproteobacteria bacterium CG2_30_43_15]|nr:MAG: hypothetical protein AUK23_03170 [Deltaproteobacteria bacterium CG2_30_43_15]
MIRIDCPLCESGKFKEVFFKNNYHIVKCIKCGLLFVNPMPSEKEIEKYYKEDFYDEEKFVETTGKTFEYLHKSTQRRADEYKPFLDYLKENAPPPGKLIDIGCGDGTFLELAKGCGWDVSGIEPSKRATTFCVEKGLNVFNQSYERVKFEDDSFNVVTSFVLIEHLCEPKKLLSYMFKILKPGGVALITTCNIDSYEAKQKGVAWDNLIPPVHLIYFSPKTLSRMIGKIGFKKIDISTNAEIIVPEPGTLYYFFLANVKKILNRWPRVKMMAASLSARILKDVNELIGKITKREGRDIVFFVTKK